MFSHWPWSYSVAHSVHTFISFFSLFPHIISTNQGWCMKEHSGPATTLHNSFRIITVITEHCEQLHRMQRVTKQHYSYICSLTINSAWFRRWKRSVRDGELIQHCAGVNIVWQGGHFIMTHLYQTPTTSLYCAKLPFVLLSVSHPALERWALGLILLSNRSTTQGSQTTVQV